MGVERPPLPAFSYIVLEKSLLDFLIMLFFGLVYSSVRPPPPRNLGNISADTLA